MENKRFCDLVVGDNLSTSHSGRIHDAYVSERKIIDIEKSFNNTKIVTEFVNYIIKDESIAKDFLILTDGLVKIATSMDKLLLECGDINEQRKSNV